MVDRVVIPMSAVICAALVMVIYSLWYVDHPISDFRRLAWPEEVRPGQEVNIRATVTRTKGGCSSVVTRRWLNEAEIDLVPPEIQHVQALPAGGETFVAKVPVPLNAKQGLLIMRVRAEFRCNLVQDLLGGTQLPLYDMIFTVLP